MSVPKWVKAIVPYGLRRRLRNVQAGRYSRRHSARVGPLRAELGRIFELRPLLASMMERSTWCLDRVHVDEDGVRIEGWALPNADEYCPVTFTVNGVEFAEIDFPGYRADIGDLFWYRRAAGWSAFVCRSPISSEALFVNGPAAFQFCEKRTLQPLREEHTFYWMDPSADSVPLPSAERRKRVHGNTDAASFRAQGSSAFVKIERALNKVCGKGFADFPRILDWGCGSGRVTRYFQSLPDVSVTGIDIDVNNIEWCRENLPFAEFSACDLDPPTRFESASFDLIFGISVMTHLAESDRFAWLRELNRIASDGAICMLTVQGAVSLSRTSVELDYLARWKQNGFIDVGTSLAAEELSSEPDRYIDCFLSGEYLRDMWSEQFEILEILPGYIGNMQDLVIMQKRSG